MSLRCIRHGELDPAKSPELSCKICCKLFVTAIKIRQQEKTKKKGGMIQRWLDDRSKVGTNQSAPMIEFQEPQNERVKS